MSNNKQTEVLTPITSKQSSLSKEAKRAKRRRRQMLRQKRAETKKRAEANARRKLAKSWAFIGAGNKYQKAAVKESCSRITSEIKENFINGIHLDLREKNSVKSDIVQKRILRRVVEKRQAQASRRITGHTQDLFASHLVRECCSKSMKEINHFRRYSQQLNAVI